MAVKYEEEEKPEVQLTSMMDCIFLMLIFFLVSSQLKKIEKEVPLELPVSNVARDVKATPDLITVSVDSKGDLYVNSVALSVYVYRFVNDFLVRIHFLHETDDTFGFMISDMLIPAVA